MTAQKCPVHGVALVPSQSHDYAPAVCPRCQARRNGGEPR
jgi:Zn-finger nucleic acid-binding protein